MNDILEEILTYKREEVEQWKQYIPLKQLYGMMEYGKLEKIEQPSLQLALKSQIQELLRSSTEDSFAPMD